ncbi:MAG: ABC transporter ATP-binding protein [Acidobacteriota bacterium]|nr:ABC transporter ATP-binding protein [Acidobacteriota bacterium]
MSKVQSPKYQSGGSEAAEARQSAKASIPGEEADVEHLTLDIGPALTVTDLRKSFSSPSGERIEVLRGASFSAGPGETVAIMGSSGAGKSTLLHLLGGLEAADHGTIVAGQFSVDSARPSALAHFRNNRVGFVFQFHHLLPDLTAVENVSLPLMINRTSRREALRRATRALEDVGLGDRISHAAGHLSGGEQQRVAVCRALVSRPALVLADEPTGNLDTAIGDKIAHSLVSYGRDNRALVIIATHNRVVADLCDRILMLRDGRLSNR